MLVVRPAGPADLDHLLELAILSGPGFTSLTEDPDALSERLELSQASFRGQVAPQEAWYTLMLEDGDTGDIDGVGSVKATVGLKRPFFSFRVVNNTVQSPSLGVKLNHQTLVLVNECTGWTEVGSLFLKADRRLDRTDPVDVAGLGLLQHQGVPAVLRFDSAGETVTAEVQPLGQGVGILGQAGEAGAGQDGQLQQMIEIGRAGGTDDKHSIEFPSAGISVWPRRSRPRRSCTG